MERVIKILMVFMSLFTFQEVIADNNTTSDDEEEKVEILVPTPPIGPRMPSEIFLECHYSPGHISFVIPTGISFLEVSIKNDNNVMWEGVIPQSYPEANIPILPSGEYSIICRSDENQTFQGLLSH